MIGFGSIGRGTLPLIERHFEFDRSKVTVIDPSDEGRARIEGKGFTFIHQPITRDNYRHLLGPLLQAGPRAGLLRQPLGRHLLARHHGVLPRDRRALHRHGRRAVARLLLTTRRWTPRSGPTTRCARTILAARRRNPGGTTAVSCCGANPGMVSWFVKQALLDIERDTGHCRRRAEDARGLGRAVPRRSA